MTSPFALAKKTDRLPVRGREPTTEADLSSLRSDEVAGRVRGWEEQHAESSPYPNLDAPLFTDAVTAGLARPTQGLATAANPFLHPGTTFGERYEGGKRAYADKLRQAEEDAVVPPILQQIAGGTIMGGPSGSLWKQGAFDAATGGVQSWAGDNDWTQILTDALTNAGMGGVLNAAGAGKGMLDERDDLVQELLKLYRGGQ